MKKLVLTIAVAVVVGLFFFSFYTQEDQVPEDVRHQAEVACITLCEDISEGLDLSYGPCLSDNNPDWNIDGWVCDVAHSPRQDVDNLPENQCQDYIEGRARRFVEVDDYCDLIRSV